MPTSIHSKKSFLQKFEDLGNKIPDPIVLYVWICVILLVFTKIFGGLTVVHPGTGAEVSSVDLLTKSGLQWLFTSMPANFLAFTPLGAVLTICLGTGVAEKSGFMNALIRSSGANTGKNTVVAIVCLVGIMSNLAGDAGWIVLPPLAAMMFQAVGRNPLVGMTLAYAMASCGMGSNLIIGMSDVLAGTFTIQAAQSIDPGFIGNIAMNYYMEIIFVFVELILGIWVTVKIIEPKFGPYQGEVLFDSSTLLSSDEKKGIQYALISLAVMVLVIVALSIGPNAFFKDPESGSLITGKAPLMQGVVPIITVLFLVSGVIYGRTVKTIKNASDLVKMLSDSIKDMGNYIVLSFVAAQFMAWFSRSNLSIVSAVNGANVLRSLNMHPIALVIILIIFCALIDLILTSASAKWAILAPVFVPMFMLLGFHPAATQMAYRIGDALTNSISPLFSYAILQVSLMQKYDKKAGMGTLIAYQLPYAGIIGVARIMILIVFIMLNIPVGPDGPIFLSIG